MSPLISVLMPAYLRSGGYTEQRWFSEALHSVRDACGDHPFEIILVDNLSPQPISLDSFGWAESHVRLVRAPVQLGMIRALNLAASHARGELLARIDADDTWAVDRIPLQLKSLQEDPELTLVFGSMHLLDAAGRTTETHLRAFDHAETLAFFPRGGCAVPHGSVLMRKSVFQALGGYPYGPDVLHIEDFALWTVWARFFRIRGLPEVLLNYRVHDTSISGNNRDRMAANSAAVMKQAGRVGPPGVYVAALQTLATAWNLTATEAGLKLHRLWNYGGCVPAEGEVLAALRRVLFDRCVQRIGLQSNQARVSEL
jgi:glycosyltransferase involved in cell wall biosynthesis